MLMLRLSRTGRKNFPSYEVTVSEKTNHPQSGKAVEVVGFYQPRGKAEEFRFKKDRIDYWMSRGAMVSETLARMLHKQGVAGMEKFALLDKKYQQKKKGKEEAKAGAPAAAPATPPAA